MRSDCEQTVPLFEQFVIRNLQYESSQIHQGKTMSARLAAPTTFCDSVLEIRDKRSSDSLATELFELISLNVITTVMIQINEAITLPVMTGKLKLCIDYIFYFLITMQMMFPFFAYLYM